jgi:hypothetical protein
MWVYRTAKARAQCLKPPPAWIGGWLGAYLLNATIAGVFLVGGVGFGCWAAVENLASNVHTLGLFQKCYQVHVVPDHLSMHVVMCTMQSDVSLCAVCCSAPAS